MPARPHGTADTAARRPAPLLRLLQVLDRLLQVVVRPGPHQVAWISDPDYVGNAYHLFRHTITERTGLTHVWLVVDDDVGRRIEADFAAWGGPERGHRLRVLRRHGPAGYVAFLRSRVSFHTHGVYRWTVSAVGRACVSLWHGMPIKAIGALNTVSPNPHPTYGTLHLATSDFFRYVIAAVFEVAAQDVLLTGLPRCDVLHEPGRWAPDEAEIRDRLDLPADGPLVLWLPTYRTIRGTVDPPPGVVGFQTFLDDLTEDQWRRIDQQARRVGATVVVKLHPFDALNDVDHHLDLPAVRLVRSPEWGALGTELYDVLAVADGLISDLSSVLVDWLPTGRALGMVGFDADRYTRDLLFPASTIRDSRRVRDLADVSALAAFFDQVAGGPGSADDDLSTWLYPPTRTRGCETVLRAVGL